MFVKSKNIKVYPSAYRGKVQIDNVWKLFDPESRLPDEYNITNQAYQLISHNEGFISYPTAETLNTWNETKLIFNIAGYRFELNHDAITALKAQGTKVYANIITVAKNPVADNIDITDYLATSLSDFNRTSETLDSSLDSIDNSEFTGVSFSSSSGGNYSLELFEENGDLCKKSFIKFHRADILGGFIEGKPFSLAEYLETKDIKATEEVITNKIVDGTHQHSIILKKEGHLEINAQTTKVSDTLHVLGVVEADQGLIINGVSQLKGDTTINKLTVDTTTKLKGAVTIDSTLNVSGQITGQSFFARSDKRLKENIIAYKSEKSILDLPVYKYDFIDGSKNNIGCLAQDLKEICPEIVHTNNDGYLNIEESKIVYLLLDEVKKLRKEVNELKGE